MSLPPAPVSSPASLRRQARGFRVAAMVFCLLGVAGAGADYWLQSHHSDEINDPGMIGFDRKEQQQVSTLYGQQGQVMDGLNHAIAQPGVQAIFILATAGMLGGACLYFARKLDEDAISASGGDSSGQSDT